MKIITLTLLISLFCVSQIKSTKYKHKHPPDIITEEKLLSYIKELKIAHPKIVLTQAKLESGNFKSNIFKSNKNIFGMKYPERRVTTAIGIHKNHSVYSSWRSSVDDYKIWQDKYAKKYKTKKQYLKYLALYAEDKNYVSKIQKNLL
jgi:flagellum-specific peptidoglycan hydrolase FlgJ